MGYENPAKKIKAQQEIINVLEQQAKEAAARYEENIRERKEALEDYLAFQLKQENITQTLAAKTVGTSRDRIRGMVKRSNDRLAAQLRETFGIE